MIYANGPMSVKKEQIVRKTKAHEYVVDEHGTKKAVIVPIEEYEAFQELLEDLDDLSVIIERQNDEQIPYEEVRERLKRDGLL